MATELVEVRGFGFAEPFEAEDLFPNVSLGSKRFTSGERLTGLGSVDPWAVRVCRESFSRMKAPCLEWQFAGVESAESTRSPTAVPGPISTELAPSVISQIQQKFIQSLAELQQHSPSRETEREEETWDWDVVVDPPQERPVRQMIFHLVRRGYQQPRIIDEEE